MAIFLLLNIIVCLAAFLLVYKIFKGDSLLDSLVIWFILYFAQIVFSELLLGIVGVLYLRNLVFLNLLILLAIWLSTWKYRISFSFNSSLFVFFKNKAPIFVISLILGFGLVKIFVNLINPPFGWDCLNYHYAFPVEWLKHGNLNNPIVVSDDPFPTYYPLNGSLFFFWLILPFRSAFLADLGQLPFLIIAFLAIISISRKLKLSREYSFLSASLFVLIPNVFKQLEIGYVDIMVGGVFFALLNFLLSLKEEVDLKRIIIFAITFGLFIGIKTTCLTYSVLIFAPFAILIVLQKDLSIAKKIGFFALFSLLIVLFGGYSYIKNFLLTRNPFYPLDVVLPGRIILFKGVIDMATFTCRNPGSGYSLARFLFHEGLGVQAMVVILPAVLLAAPINIFFRKDRNLFLNYLFVLPLLLYLVFRYILPIPNSRYMYPVLGLGIIAGFYTFNSLKIPKKIINGLAIIFLIASAFECARKAQLISSLIIFLLLFTILIVFFNSKLLAIKKALGRVLITICVLSLLITQILFFYYERNQYRSYLTKIPYWLEIRPPLFYIFQILRFNYDEFEYLRYIKNSRYWFDATKAWEWLNKNSYNDNIAYVGRPIPYPLYGTHYKNNVFYVSLNKIDPIHLHDLKESMYRWRDAEGMHRSFGEKNNYRGNADYAVWLKNLKKRLADFLFVYSLHHTEETLFPIEEDWARAHPDKFILVYSNETVKIYKIKR